MNDRFWSKVDTSAGPDGCWLWLAAKNHAGYGTFRLDGRQRPAHRIAYELTSGECVSAVFEMDHICHSPSCVNPRHLRPTTRKQNSENRRGARRDSKSGIRGVSRNKTTGRWRVRVYHHGRPIDVGHFDTIAEAEAAAIATRCKLHTHNELDKQAAASAEPVQLELFEERAA